VAVVMLETSFVMSSSSTAFLLRSGAVIVTVVTLKRLGASASPYGFLVCRLAAAALTSVAKGLAVTPTHRGIRVLVVVSLLYPQQDVVFAGSDDVPKLPLWLAQALQDAGPQLHGLRCCLKNHNYTPYAVASLSKRWIKALRKKRTRT
jgi:hypothetical protein